MITGLLVAFALQALPSGTANWRDVTAPGDESPTWIDTTSVRGPRTHREVVLRLVDRKTKGYGYMSVVVDCEARTMVFVAFRRVDPAGNVTIDKQYTLNEAPHGTFEKDDNGFASVVCAMAI